MNISFLHCQNLPLIGYIHCNFCLNPHTIHGDMKENVSECFFSEHSVVSVGRVGCPHHNSPHLGRVGRASWRWGDVTGYHEF